MTVRILFTRSTKIGSRLIRAVTKEPVSHCAIHIGDVVLHATRGGVQLVPYSVFARNYEVCYFAEVRRPAEEVKRTIDSYWGLGYDYGALLYLGFRYFLPFLPKANLWAASGLFLCTELVNEFVGLEGDEWLTPLQLFQRIKDMESLS